MIHTINYPFIALTLNEIIREAKKSPHAYAKLKNMYTRDCAMCSLGSPSFPGKVWLSFHWYVSTLRRDPADNTPAAAKFVLDGLVEAGILKDDSGYVIQPPIVHTWQVQKPEGLRLTISDKPIYVIQEIELCN